MIYSGLEFGQYFELERDTKCHNVMLALTPATRMCFIFIQMYFIFLNNEVTPLYNPVVYKYSNNELRVFVQQIALCVRKFKNIVHAVETCGEC